MEGSQSIPDFIAAIHNDPFLGLTHIGFYAVLSGFVRTAPEAGCRRVSKAEVMGAAKIGSPNTYFRLLSDLSERGYIRYEPSFNPKGGSRIYLGSTDKNRMLIITTKKSDENKEDEMESTAISHADGHGTGGLLPESHGTCGGW